MKIDKVADLKWNLKNRWQKQNYDIFQSFWKLKGNRCSEGREIIKSSKSNFLTKINFSMVNKRIIQFRFRQVDWSITDCESHKCYG